MEPEHIDPFSESARGGLEKLMALGVLAEAGSRFVAERRRQDAAQQERQIERDRAAQQVDRQALRLTAAEQARRLRQWQALAGDPQRLAGHLRGLPVQEVARHWLHTTQQAAGDPIAERVRAGAEAELRNRLPTLMDSYDRARREGAAAPEAMRTAVADVFGERARRHGATPYSGGALPVLDRELEQHLRRSAGQLDEVGRARWLRSLEEQGWSPESLAWAEAMLTRAESERRIAAAAGATVDDPDTVHNERADGLTEATAATARADDRARDAAAVAATAGVPPSGSSSTRGLPAKPQAARGQVGGVPGAAPARVAGLAFAAPPHMVLRPAVPPRALPPGSTPEHTTTRGRGR